MGDCNEKSASDLFPDRIFVRGHLTKFEKLLFADAEIKELKKENAILQIELGKANSHIEELKHTINHSKELIDIQSVKMSIDRLRKNNKNLTEENKRLRSELLKLKNT